MAQIIELRIARSERDAAPEDDPIAGMSEEDLTRELLDIWQRCVNDPQAPVHKRMRAWRMLRPRLPEFVAKARAQGARRGVRERCQDLWGRAGWRWRVIRTSNAYALFDPASKSDQRTGTPDQEIQKPLQAPAVGLNSTLERALARFAAALAAKDGIEQEAAG